MAQPNQFTATDLAERIRSLGQQADGIGSFLDYRSIFGELAAQQNISSSHMLDAQRYAMQAAQQRQNDQMAYLYNTGTTTNTTTTSGTGDWLFHPATKHQRIVQAKPKAPKRVPKVTVSPWPHKGADFLTNLQYEFNQWAGKTQKEIFSGC